MMGTWISGILVVLSEIKVRGLRGNNPIVSMLGHLWESTGLAGMMLSCKEATQAEGAK